MDFPGSMDFPERGPTRHAVVWCFPRAVKIVDTESQSVCLVYVTAAEARVGLQPRIGLVVRQTSVCATDLTIHDDRHDNFQKGGPLAMLCVTAEARDRLEPRIAPMVRKTSVRFTDLTIRDDRHDTFQKGGPPACSAAPTRMSLRHC